MVYESGSLSQKLNSILIELGTNYYKQNLFARRNFEPASTKFSVILEIDYNKVQKQQLKQLLKLIKEYREKFQDQAKNITFITAKRPRKGNNEPWEIYFRDDIKIMNSIQIHSLTSKQEIEQLNL